MRSRSAPLTASWLCGEPTLYNRSDIAGPPPRPLPIIELEIVDDDVFAIGELALDDVALAAASGEAVKPVMLMLMLMPMTWTLIVAMIVAGTHLGCAPDKASAPTSASRDGSDHGSAGAHSHGSGAPGGPAEAPAALPPGNVVQTEMRMLTSILEATVRGIGARDVRPIEHALHRLHAAKDATTAALRDGSYKLPMNPDKVDAFVAMDEAFHKDLGALVSASRANDVPRAADALGAILRGCEGCHATFRPALAPAP